MPFKDLEKRRKYRREWYSKNKISERNQIKRRREKIKRWYKSYKKNLKCEICKETHPAVLEFHHKKRNQKENQIALMVNDGYSIEKILLEISKCQVLCSNCHRKLHWENKMDNL